MEGISLILFFITTSNSTTLFIMLERGLYARIIIILKEVIVAHLSNIVNMYFGQLMFIIVLQWYGDHQ